jgi:hypothetical protein
MSRTVELQTERLKRLSIDSTDTWQGSVRPTPAWVLEGGQRGKTSRKGRKKRRGR